MADSKDIVNMLGGTEKPLNDMHAIKEVLKNGAGGGSWEHETPVKLGSFKSGDDSYTVYRYITAGNALTSNIPQDLLSSLNITFIIDAFGIASVSDVQKRNEIYYNSITKNITFERENEWITTIYVTYFVKD